MKLFDSTRIPILNKALDAYSARHKVIASNIANIATIGYRAQAVSFNEELSGAMEQPMLRPATTNERHIVAPGTSDGKSHVQVVDAASAGLNPVDPNDGVPNNVNIDNEMAELAKNQIRYKFSSKLLGETFRGLQKSIRGTA